MKTTYITILRGLIAASLFTLSGFSTAQDSVSSFEQSLPEPQSAEQTGTSSVALDTNQLADRLKAAGWKVTQETNGDLVVVPPGTDTGKENQWEQIQRQLRGTGWYAEQDADGALILIPPGNTTGSENPSSSITRVTDNNADTLQSMQQKLREAGWHVNEAADGSILLYPPGETTSVKARPCAGTPPGIDIDLPVNTWQEAFDISKEWLGNQPDLPASVGRIRKIFDVYIVSIVSNKAPHTLTQQIAIRNSDGTVIVLN